MRRRSDKPNVQKEASATGMLRRMKERIQLGRVVSPPSPHAPMHRAGGFDAKDDKATS